MSAQDAVSVALSEQMIRIANKRQPIGLVGPLSRYAGYATPKSSTTVEEIHAKWLDHTR